MKKYLIATCLLTAISLLSVGQSIDTTARIKSFIKVWGFLKYYHPTIAEGKLDWDNVFVNNIPGIVKATNNKEFNGLLLTTINGVGATSKIAEKKRPDSLFTLNETTIDWVNKSTIFNATIKTTLQHINANRNPDSNKHIKIVNNTADFSGEDKYDNIGFPNLNYRLLFLSRFWNIINYFAPYKYLTTNWDDVLEKFIPKIIHSTDSLSYYKTLQELCKSLNDGHSQLALNGQMLPDLFFGKYTVPFYSDIINDTVTVRNVPNDSMAKALNVQQGDIVLKVDGEEMSKVMNYRKKYIAASNQAGEAHQLSGYILDGQTPAVTLEIKRGKELIKTSVTRVATSNRDWSAFINYTYNDVGYKKLNDSVLLIYAMQIWDGNIDTIKHLIKQSKVVIFDVRNYPQNDAFFYIADPFLSEPKTIDYSTVALPQFPGLFKWTINPNKIGRISDSAYKGKVIILCDERTQSQGEYSCMVLQTIPGAITIGSQTAGADGIVTNIPMGGGLTISYSGYGVYYPDKTQTQRKGVKIDIWVRKTTGAIKNNKDEILERALQYINSNQKENYNN